MGYVFCTLWFVIVVFSVVVVDTVYSCKRLVYYSLTESHNNITLLYWPLDTCSVVVVVVFLCLCFFFVSLSSRPLFRLMTVGMKTMVPFLRFLLTYLYNICSTAHAPTNSLPGDLAKCLFIWLWKKARHDHRPVVISSWVFSSTLSDSLMQKKKENQGEGWSSWEREATNQNNKRTKKNDKQTTNSKWTNEKGKKVNNQRNTWAVQKKRRIEEKKQ